MWNQLIEGTLNLNEGNIEVCTEQLILFPLFFLFNVKAICVKL